MKEKLSSLLSLAFSNRKYLFLIIGVAILGEIFWAMGVVSPDFSKLGSFFSKTSSSQVVDITKQVVKNQVTSINLSAPKTSLKVGDEVTVSINISSQKFTDGTDLIVVFNPELFSVVLDPNNQAPLRAGSIYNDFPLNSVDISEGKVTVSGISSASGGVLAQGLFGTVVFQAKKAGAVEVSLEFTPGNTTDSNVIETKTAKDLLTEVNTLRFNITP